MLLFFSFQGNVRIPEFAHVTVQSANQKAIALPVRKDGVGVCRTTVKDVRNLIN